MHTQIVVNLPVKDLDKSVEFYSALGFVVNPQFGNEKSTSMMIDDDIFVMLIQEEFFKTFTNKELCDSRHSTEAIIPLTVETHDEVDEFVNKALESGVQPSTAHVEMANLYSWSFQDPDGHLWEVMHIETGGVSI